MQAWHFLPDDKRLGYGDGRLVELGVPLECEGDLALCENGMHGSVRLIDALRYAAGPIVCRVEIEGDIIKDDDKLCGRRRTVLWWLDATRILHEFACLCAEDALALVAQPDARSVAAIDAKRRWLRGEITDKELDAAWDAARDAARWAANAVADAAALAAARWAANAAAVAARAAARAAWRAADVAADAAASDAAWAAADTAAAAAALAAALAAARAAAWNAASAAACAAARYFAWVAARDDTWAKQNARLTEMVMQAHEATP